MDTPLAIEQYEQPALAWPDEPGQETQIVWWVVWVGFAYLLALAYATYCRYTGGNADISLTWHGFKVECKG